MRAELTQGRASRPEGSRAAIPRLEIADEDFSEICALIKRLSGFSLSRSKRELVQSRLGRRIRQLGLRSFSEYLELLRAGCEQEEVAFCNSLTTNLTSFFREPHHFEFLRDAVLAPLSKLPPPGPRLRIWSSACSSGEEPY